MANIVKFNDDAKQKMARGIKILKDAVKVTLGPKGRNVIIEQDFGAPLIVNDGVTIAKSIVLSDKFENLGVSVLIEAASKTNDLVGDGTTTAIILASNLIEEGLEVLQKGVNPVTLRNGLTFYLDYILEMIDSKSTLVKSSEDLRQVATISSQSKKIGEFISAAYEEVGPNGLVMVEEAQSLETYLDVVKGYSYDRGYLSLYMVNDKEKMQAVLDNPYVLITDKKINNMQELLPHLEKTMKNGIGFDASNYGYAVVEKSDMVFIPDPNTAVIDPFCEIPTLSMTGNAMIIDNPENRPLAQYPRNIVLAAEQYMKDLGVADTMYILPEFEFYLFDDVSWEVKPYSIGMNLDASQAYWNGSTNGTGYVVKKQKNYQKTNNKIFPKQCLKKSPKYIHIDTIKRLI